jgi:hypothetical protein
MGYISWPAIAHLSCFADAPNKLLEVSARFWTAGVSDIITMQLEMHHQCSLYLTVLLGSKIRYEDPGGVFFFAAWASTYHFYVLASYEASLGKGLGLMHYVLGNPKEKYETPYNYQLPCELRVDTRRGSDWLAESQRPIEKRYGHSHNERDRARGRLVEDSCFSAT